MDTRVAGMAFVGRLNYGLVVDINSDLGASQSTRVCLAKFSLKVIQCKGFFDIDVSLDPIPWEVPNRLKLNAAHCKKHSLCL